MINSEAIRHLAEAATPGPWAWQETSESPQYGDRGPYLVRSGGTRVILSAEGDGDGANLYIDAADAAFIAATSPVAVLALIAELEQLRAQVRPDSVVRPSE